MHSMRLQRVIMVVMSATYFSACGGGRGEEQQSPVTFAFRLHGLSATEEFRATTSSPDVISQARSQLLLAEADRHLFAAGDISAGNRGNLNGVGISSIFPWPKSPSNSVTEGQAMLRLIWTTGSTRWGAFVPGRLTSMRRCSEPSGPPHLDGQLS